MNGIKVETIGVRMNEQNVQSIRFADDIALVAGKEDDMNEMLNILAEKLIKYKLKINTNKTKTMIVKKSRSNINAEAHIYLGDTSIQQVTEFCYLGSIISKDNKTNIDIKRRIAIAKQAFLKKILIVSKQAFSIRNWNFFH